MSDDHKAALAQGRAEGRVVRRYLETLRTAKPARGPKRTAESITKRLAAIDEQLLTADAMTELKLVQQRRDLSTELARLGDQVDDGTSEADFIAVAKAYSERQGISYAAWREVGVPGAVLNRAGIARNS
jgi:hypothetical protein